ncbi:MAG: D-alanine--D-alanine ligase family protein [Thermoanaerobaculales bacterium]
MGATSSSKRRVRLALIFGGRSDEHDVSVVSARSVDRSLDRELYEVVPMAIDRTGLWADAEDALQVLAESGDRTDQVVGFAGRHRLDPRLLSEDFDVAFPVLHGPFGEDGAIQGLFEILGLAYVGCDPTASSLCMDKVLTKRVIAHAGLPTPAWIEIERARWEVDRERIVEACIALDFPVFVKPSRLGSSIGISKVKATEDLAAAVEVALGHGGNVLVECGLEAREIEVAVLGNEDPRASVPGEVIPGHEFYDYEDKYLDSACELLAPAPLDETTTRSVQELALQVFRLLGCNGMARVDLFLEKDTGELWVNEANTIPGFTPISMFPRLWGLSGLAYPALLDELVRLALRRTQR